MPADDSGSGGGGGDIGFARQQLRSYVERVERMNEEIAAMNADKSDIFAEAKANGFDVPSLKRVIALRKLSKDDLAEREAIDQLYRKALGMD